MQDCQLIETGVFLLLVPVIAVFIVPTSGFCLCVHNAKARLSFVFAA